MSKMSCNDIPASCYGFCLNKNDGGGQKKVIYLPHNQLSVVPRPSDLGWNREGYIFVGWENGSGKLCYVPGASSKAPIAAGKVLDLFAKWILMPGYREIRFFANDGSGRFRDSVFPIDHSSELPQPMDYGWSRVNCTFKGWRNINGKRCCGSEVEVLNPNIPGTRLNLYADWESLCFELRFHSNDDTGKVKSFKIPCVAPDSVSVPPDMGWKRKGFEFGGWLAKPNGVCVYPDGSFVYKTAKPNSVQDIFAYWYPAFRLNKISLTYCRIKNIWREPIFKAEALKKCRDVIHEVCIGSSHAHYGYLAGDNEYNLGDPSCDAYYSFQILRYWAERLPMLSRVVYFYEIFNRGNVIDRGREGFRRIAWLYFYGMKEQTADFRWDTTLGENYHTCAEVFFQCLDECRAAVPIGYHGNAIKRCPMKNVDVQKRVAMHLKLNEGDCDRHVSEMIDYCRSRGIELVIVVPPLRYDYIRELPSGFKLHPPTGVRVINYMDSKSFVDEDFIDCDHLTEAGAKKLTRLLHEEIGRTP